MPFRLPSLPHLHKSKTPPPDETLQEAAYLKSLGEKQKPVAVKLVDGEVVRGWIEYYDRDQEELPLFERYFVHEQLHRALDRKVFLPSGGSLIIERTEALTVVDVNTGKNVGTTNLEETVFRNNLEAAEEVARQLRLRDIGGIIVIDFIDMANPKNRAAVEEALRSELERDRTKTYVVEISPLGLVEMTRQNVTDGPREIMTVKCEVCGGDGIIVSDETHAIRIERELRRVVTASRHQAYRIELNSRVAAALVGLFGGPVALLVIGVAFGAAAAGGAVTRPTANATPPMATTAARLSTTVPSATRPPALRGDSDGCRGSGSTRSGGVSKSGRGADSYS